MGRQKGFTLLELVVVVAIIGILAAVTMTLFSGIQEKNRDARRMNDLKQLENALNLYSTNHGNFPVEPTEITITGSDGLSDELILDGAIDAVSADPVSPAYDYTYQTNANGTAYTITFCLETDTVQRFSEGCGNTLTP